jgi:mannose-6-phosphate isomerase-like protein (cupin superfamily)
MIKTGTKTEVLYKGIAVLVPANLEFIMTNTEDEPLTMLLICEPIPEGFRVNKEMLVKDENKIPYDQSAAHWCMVIKGIFGVDDGLGTLQGVATMTFSPMTMGQPHSHIEGCEEVWTALEGKDINLLRGKQLCKQPPGTAFKIPPDGNTPHSTINTANKSIKMFFFARFGEHVLRK